MIGTVLSSRKKSYPVQGAIPAAASHLTPPPETPAILGKIYSFDLEGAAEAAKRMQHDQPNHPLGYLLETEALWWQTWCRSADFKYGMSDARRRPKLEADRHYFELTAKALSLAEAQIKQSESAEMEFYAGIAEASSATEVNAPPMPCARTPFSLTEKAEGYAAGVIARQPARTA